MSAQRGVDRGDAVHYVGLGQPQVAEVVRKHLRHLETKTPIEIVRLRLTGI